jgi:hypothetical protein
MKPWTLFATAISTCWRIWKDKSQPQQRNLPHHQDWIRNARDLLQLEPKILRDVTGLTRQELRYQIALYRKHHRL